MADPRRFRGGLALLLTGSLLAGACAPSGVSERRAAGTRARRAEFSELRALLLLAADQKRFEPFSFRQALGRGDDTLRADLAVAVGRVGAPEGEAMLETLLEDRAPEVRRAAAFNLGLLGGEEAVPALLRAVADSDPVTGSLAVEALGKLGTPLPQVAGALLALSDGELLGRLLPHLFRFEDPLVISLARRGLASEDPALRKWAAYALARRPRPEAAPLLRTLVTDTDPRIRAWAARGLGLVGSGPDLHLLRPLLDEARGGPLVQALRAAAALVADGRAAAPVDWIPRLLELLDHPLPGVRATAIEAAARWLLDPRLSEALRERARTGSERERELALAALAEGGDRRAPELVATAAASPSATERAAAAAAAGYLGDEDLLERLVKDPERLVRRAAVAAALESIEDATGRFAAAALGDADSGVRATALAWLAEHPVLPATLVRRAVRGRTEDVVELPLEAIVALSARRRREPEEEPAVVEALEWLARDERFVVRRAAARALGELGRPRPAVGTVETGRGVEAYRELVLRTRSPRWVRMTTERGILDLRLACPRAPLTCVSFLQLSEQGFFDGLRFHRVVPDFVVQGGDPRGDGYGGPGYELRDEINPLRFVRGSVGMALAGADTGGSQFFIALAPQPHLDGGYTLFGQVVGGDAVLDRLAQGDRILEVREIPAPAAGR